MHATHERTRRRHPARTAPRRRRSRSTRRPRRSIGRESRTRRPWTWIRASAGPVRRRRRWSTPSSEPADATVAKPSARRDETLDMPRLGRLEAGSRSRPTERGPGRWTTLADRGRPNSRRHDRSTAPRPGPTMAGRRGRSAGRARVRDPRGDRPGRHGRRLQGQAGPARPAGRPEDDPGRRRTPRHDQLARFHIEAKAVARLQHPNIVQIHEVGEHEGMPYFSLEFVAGGSLAEVIGGKPQPPLRRRRR